MQAQEQETSPDVRSKKEKRLGLLKMTPNVPGRFMMISKHNLNVAREAGGYQRPAQSTVADIRKNFHWVLFEIMTVGKRPDGTYWIIEGGTRHEAVMGMEGIDKVPCMVHDMTEQKDEAAAFNHIASSRKKISTYWRWNAAVAAGDPHVIKVRNLLRKYGYEASPGGQSKYTFTCTDSIMKMAEDFERLEKLVPLLVAIHNGDTLHTHIVVGLTTIYEKGGEQWLMRKPVQARMISLGRSGLIESIAEVRAGRGGKGGTVTNGSGVWKITNKGMKKPNRLDNIVF